MEHFPMRIRRALLLLTLAALASFAAGVSGSEGQTGAPDAHRLTRPQLLNDQIPFGHRRKHETAAYNKRHYGQHQWRLSDPKVIVLHFTDGPTWQSARATFASDAPNLGEEPGVCSHFVIDQNGRIHEIVRPTIRCRHTIGLNYTSIGIEMVQEAPAGSHQADLAILHRRPQIHAALHLVAYLVRKHGIPLREVIGHSMANDDHYFRDREGWRNDHTDWQRHDVKRFRKRLRSRYGL